MSYFMPPMTTPQIPMAPVVPIMPPVPPMFPLMNFKRNLKKPEDSNMLFYIYMLILVIVLFIIGSVSTGSSTFTQIPISTLKNNEDLILDIQEERVFINTTEEESAAGFIETRNQKAILSISEKENIFSGLTLSNLTDVNLNLNKYNVDEIGTTNFQDAEDIDTGTPVAKIKGYCTQENGKKVEIARIEVKTDEFSISIKPDANVYQNGTVNPCFRIDNLGRAKGNFFQPLCIGAQGTAKVVKGDGDTSDGLTGLKPYSKTLILNNFNLIDQFCYEEKQNPNYTLPTDNVEVGDFVVLVLGGEIDLKFLNLNINIDDSRTFGLGSTVLNKSLNPSIGAKTGRLQLVGYYPNTDPVRRISIGRHQTNKNISNVNIKFTFMNNVGFQNKSSDNDPLTKTWCFEACVSDSNVSLELLDFTT
jgi:hypothetical protein